MERIVYIRGKFKGNNKEMKKVYFYAKEMMTKYDLKPQYIGVIGEKGWTGDKLLTIKRKTVIRGFRKRYNNKKYRFRNKRNGRKRNNK